MQKVSFRDLKEFFDYIPDDERRVVERLRALVLECLPHCTEKLAYNVPFYKIHKNICFIWPASIAWGKTVSHEGVRFGFTRGNLLRDEFNYLDKGTRKQVYWKEFRTVREIDVDVLRMLLFEAAEVDGKK